MSSVALGNDHSLALVKGKVYRWGLQCTSTRFKAADRSLQGSRSETSEGEVDTASGAINPIPTALECASETQETLCPLAIAAGGSNSYILSDIGEVFLYGQLRSLGSDTCTLRHLWGCPRRSLELQVLRIAAGWRHVLLLTKAGSVFAIGEDDYGQCSGCGTGQVAIAEASRGAIGVAAGACHSVAWGKGGAFSWGHGGAGRLGLGSTDHQRLPVQIQAFNGLSVLHASCGANFTVFVTAPTRVAVAGSGVRVWSCGGNQYGQLGIGEMEASSQILTPRIVDFALLGGSASRTRGTHGIEAVEGLECGAHHVICLTRPPGHDRRVVWAWGSAARGQCGRTFGERAEDIVPRRWFPQSLADFSPPSVHWPVGIAAGRSHSAVLARALGPLSHGNEGKDAPLPDALAWGSVGSSARPKELHVKKDMPPAVADFRASLAVASDSQNAWARRAPRRPAQESHVIDVFCQRLASQPLGRSQSLPGRSRSGMQSLIHMGEEVLKDSERPRNSWAPTHSGRPNVNMRGKGARLCASKATSWRTEPRTAQALARPRGFEAAGFVPPARENAGRRAGGGQDGSPSARMQRSSSLPYMPEGFSTQSSSALPSQRLPNTGTHLLAKERPRRPRQKTVRKEGPGWWTADTSSDEGQEEAPYVTPIAVAVAPSRPEPDIKAPVASAIPSLSEQRWSGVHSALHDLESMIAQISDGASAPKHLFGHRSGNLTSFTGGADSAAGSASKSAEASRLAKFSGSLPGGPLAESSRTAGASRVNAAQVVHQDPAALSAGRPSTPSGLSGRGGSCAVGEHAQSDPCADHGQAPSSPGKADAYAQTDLSGPGPGHQGGEAAHQAPPRLEAVSAQKAETESPGLGLGPPLEVTEASTAHPDVSKSEVADVGNTLLTIPDKEGPSSDMNRSPSLSPIPHEGGLDMTVDDSRPFSLENSSRSGSEDEGPAAQPQPASAPPLPAPAPLPGRGAPAAKELPIDSSSDSNSESLGHLELTDGKRGAAATSKSKAMTGSESESDGHLELAKSKPGASKSAAQIADDLGVLGALRSGSSSSGSSGSSRVEVAKAKPGSDGIIEVESADDSSDGF